MVTKKGVDISESIKDIKLDLTGKHIDLIFALSDNKGHGLSELAEMIGSKRPYLSKLLGELSSNQFGDLIDSISIQMFHFKDILAMVHKLQDQRDPLSKYIYENMPSVIKEKLGSSDLFEVRLSLADGLNSILCDVSLYNRERFVGVKLSEDTTKLLAQKENLKHDDDLQILNRMLIADAYPDQICKGKFSLIHQSVRISDTGSKYPYFINPDLRTFLFIMEYFKYEKDLDESRLKVMQVRLNRDLRAYAYFEENYIDTDEIKRGIKDNDDDMIYYENRYLKTQDNILKFLASDYVKELCRIYKYEEIRTALTNDRLIFKNFQKIIVKNEFISQKELDEINSKHHWQGFLNLNFIYFIIFHSFFATWIFLRIL